MASPEKGRLAANTGNVRFSGVREQGLPIRVEGLGWIAPPLQGCRGAGDCPGWVQPPESGQRLGVD